MPQSCQDIFVPATTTEEAVSYTKLVRTNVNSSGDLETNYNDNLNQGFNAGASSTQTVLDGDYIEFEIENIPVSNNNFSVGLSFNDNSTFLYEPAYGFFVQSNGNVSIRLGTSGVYNTSRAVGDKFRIERDNGTIRFKKNGVTIYSTTDTQPSSPMVADVSMWFKTGYLNRVYNLVVGKYQAASTQSVCYGNGSQGDDYRYSFQGQEHDDEVKGKGNSINYKYRMHDPRVGRFFARDPLSYQYPHNSPYAFSENQVINAVELEGLEKDLSYWNDPSLQTVRNRNTHAENIENMKAMEEGKTKGLITGVVVYAVLADLYMTRGKITSLVATEYLINKSAKTFAEFNGQDPDLIVVPAVPRPGAFPSGTSGAASQGDEVTKANTAVDDVVTEGITLKSPVRQIQTATTKFSSTKAHTWGGRVKVKSDGKMVNYDSNGEWVDFVVTNNGETFIGHGHSFMSGHAETVKHAGSAVFKNGKIIKINNGSGHYMPTPEEFNRTLEAAKNSGIVADDVQVTVWKPKTK